MPRAAQSSKTNTEYMTKGVTISPSIPTSGENIKIIYDGLLSKNGATDILARVSFDRSWNNSYDHRMTRTTTGFEVSLPVSGSDSLNICFKDCANNWDNNCGKNYSFDVVQ